MRKIKWGYCIGYESEQDVIEVEDDATEDEINKLVYEQVSNCLDWWWEDDDEWVRTQ
jgi:hypothetical protein